MWLRWIYSSWSRRLKDILNSFSEEGNKRNPQDVFKMSSSRQMFAGIMYLHLLIFEIKNQYRYITDSFDYICKIYFTYNCILFLWSNHQIKCFSITQNTFHSSMQLSDYQKVAHCTCSIASNSCSICYMNIVANYISLLFLVNNYCSHNTSTSINTDSSIESFMS